MIGAVLDDGTRGRSVASPTDHVADRPQDHDPGWRKRDGEGALRINPSDAERLGLETGGRARVSTRRATIIARVEVSDGMQRGHVSLPNGRSHEGERLGTTESGR